MVLFLVSGTFFQTKMEKRPRMTVKMMKTMPPIACSRGRKPKPTRKLAVQLTPTAMDVAAGRADWLNSSETRNHGIEPGPTANIITKIITRRILMYEITTEDS